MTLGNLASCFVTNPQLHGMLIRWLNETRDFGGCYALNYALKKHFELGPKFIQCVNLFTNRDPAIEAEFFLEVMEKHYKNRVSYSKVMNDLLDPLLALNNSG
mmetsp:Transcript_9412/g.14396  ORF Transcript_9412/g.14396 Transcript_9412/m.14396 type:complete len:102 (+) Transcript_9412:1167-1472(+)